MKGAPFPPEKGYSRWNGNYKQYTKNCDGCDDYYEVDGEERCYHGKAWKRLTRTEKPRKCQFAARPSVDNGAGSEI